VPGWLQTTAEPVCPEAASCVYLDNAASPVMGEGIIDIEDVRKVQEKKKKEASQWDF